MLRCSELGLHTDDLDHMSMGMVYDMLTERSNDREKYDLCPEPGSMKKFFSGGGKLG